MDRFVIQIQIFLNVLIWDSYIRTRFFKEARSRKKKRFLLAFALLWVQTGAIAGLILSCTLRGAHYFPVFSPIARLSSFVTGSIVRPQVKPVVQLA